MVPETDSGSTHASARRAPSVTPGDGPQRLELTPSNLADFAQDPGELHPTGTEPAPQPADKKPWRKTDRAKSDGNKAMWRRVNRRSERRPDVVFAAIPEGFQRAARGSQWLDYVRSLPQVRTMNAHGRKNFLRIAALYLGDVQVRTMTTSPGWDYIMRKGLISESTVQRHTKRLISYGALAVVASGRLAGFTPKNQGPQTNERAVYVLTVPHQLKAVEDPVDKSDGPTVRELRSNPLHAREAFQTLKGAASPPQKPSGIALEGAADPPPGHRQHSDCSLRATVAGTTRGAFREAASVAVREVMHHSLALRDARPAFLAWVFRPYFIKGWNASDILHALDNRPDSARIPHDAAKGVAPENKARWAQERLSHWLTADGTPIRSRDQRLEAEGRQKRARAEAERQRIEKDAASRRQQQLPATSWRERCAADYEHGLQEAATRRSKTPRRTPQRRRVI
ncbi:hypothetical protein ABH924_005060 [Arthrobacter sp. GAS37]|uniref:hypothetical protein n=1 Tax=Arthrobacter sp. GAS37 TaxID=3156261 RepID=UPI003837D6A9